MDMIPQKRCKQCNKLKPANPSYFHRHPRTKDRLKNVCKLCCSHGWIRQRPVAHDGYKLCSYCKQEKPATSEYFHRSPKGGIHQLTHVCKVCWKAYNLDLAEKRKQARTEQVRICTGCNKELPLTSENFHQNGVGDFDTRCKACCAQEQKAYHQANKKQFNSRRRNRYAKDPQKALTHTRNRKARIRENGGKHTAQDIQAQYDRQKGKCYYCDKRLGKRYHVDHIIPTTRNGTNDPDNLVIACPSCNESKRDKMLHEWYQGGRLL